MQSHARVVIIGGGIMGVSVMYHLVKEGWRDIVLIEKSELTSGSTWHAAALVPHFTGSATIARMTSYASRLYAGLEQETGQAAGWHGCGSLRLALNADQVDYLKYVHGVLKTVNVECHLVGPDEAAKLNPLLNVEGVLLAGYTPHDGHTDPSGTTNAMAAGAKNGGATIVRRNRVLATRQRPGGEWEVETEQGTIVAEHIVNATGFFGPQVGAIAGLKLPIVTLLHQYLVTDEVPEIKALEKELPVTRDPAASSYYRQEQKRLLVGPFEPDAPVWGLGGVDWSFDMELAPPDLDRLTPLLEAAARRLPVFEKLGIRRVINGPIAHAPDGMPLLGPAVGLRNYWIAGGTNLGIALGAGSGKNLAQLMVHGKTEDYIRGMDPRRYGDWAMTDSYRVPKVLDVYAEVYRTVHFPGEARPAGRPLRTTPLYETLKSQGAHFGDTAGWEQPQWFVPKDGEVRYSFRRSAWFDPVNAECLAVRAGVGVVDLSTFSKFEVTGQGARAFLDRLCANKLPTKDGGVALVHMLNAHGGIESEATLTRIGEQSYYLVSATASELYDFEWLTRHKNDAEDVAITNVTERRAVMAVGGPRSRDVLARLTKTDLDSAKFPWRTSQDIEISGVAVRALRISYVGELGWELHHATSDTLKLYRAVMSAGAEYNIVNFGILAVNAMRMEKAYRAWGWDMTTEFTALEAGLDRFIDFEKDFIGKNALLKRREEGVVSRIVYMSVDADDADPVGGEGVFQGGTLVGVVTSGGYGPTVRKSLAFGLVRASSAAPGTALEIEILGRRRTAEVLGAPAFDPENNRIRA